MSDRRAMAAKKGAAVKRAAPPRGRSRKAPVVHASLPTAEEAGLRFVNDSQPGISRQQVRKTFRYVGADGSRIEDAATLARIRSLAIPPAWTDVWIAPRANGHIQATGRDARKRKQYRYHPEWLRARNDAKFDRYEDEDGEARQVTSQDVNDYLREATGMAVSAKDFRTWAGTVLAAMALREHDRVDSQAAAQANIRRAIKAVAARLGNTASICRKCYVHPEVPACYLEGSLIDTMNHKIWAELKNDLAELPPEEAATLALLHSRLSAS